MSSSNVPTLTCDCNLAFLIEYIKKLESALMDQEKRHEMEMNQVRENFNTQMKVLEEKVRSHSVVLHEELSRQEEMNESILRIQCYWRRKLAIRARMKLEHAISSKVVSEAARVAIQANQEGPFMLISCLC